MPPPSAPQTTIRRLALALAALAAAGVGIGLEQAHVGASTAAKTGTASVVIPVSPFRILDTRQGIGTGGLVAPVGPGSTITVQIAGVGTVPADATGIVLNLTVSGGTSPGDITVYPNGQPRPEASVLNITPGQDLPNMITAALGTGGKLDLYNFAGSVHLIADVAAYLSPSTGGAGTGTQGPQGAQGVQGPRGLSAWDTIPSGVTVIGEWIYDASATGALTSDAFSIDLPGVAPSPLTNVTVNFAPSPAASDDDTSCTGTYTAPTAPTGKLCLYLGASQNVSLLAAQPNILATRAFFVSYSPGGVAGADLLIYLTWAYTAP